MRRRAWVALLLCMTLLPTGVARARVAVMAGSGGAVASVSEPASQAAIAILDEGGNAIDAAVAAAATLGVTDPFSCGLGGGGFLMLYLAADRRVITIDHRETAPAAFHPDIFREHGTEIGFDAAVRSGLSVGVPGTVRGWEQALVRFGTMSFEQVLAPAIRLAEAGFVVSPQFHRFVRYNEPKFAAFRETAKLYLPDGKPIPAGTTFRNPELAVAYREIARKGARAFYAGPIADAIVGTITEPAVASGITDVRKGVMTLADLANYESRLRLPLRSTYRGYEIYGMPLPSSGGITVALALNILEGFALESMKGTEIEHLYLEASRLAYADRNTFVGDPEYVDVPVAGLVSKEYAAERRRLIDTHRAAGPRSAGDPWRHQDDRSPSRARPATVAAALVGAEGAHTTHFTVADKHGNMVAYTFTIEDWGGSGIVVPGYGFLLNNEMTDFDFTGPHPNVPEPGKRPRSSMSPTIVLKNGKPAFTIGAPGGSTIITTVLQVIVNHIDLGMSLEQAVAAPRISQRNRDTSTVEAGFRGGPQAKALERYGHRWEGNEFGEIGYANALFFDDDGSVTAISEPARGGGGSAIAQRPGH